MIPLSILGLAVSIKRRKSTTIYTNVRVRLAFSSKPTRFVLEGERVEPIGTMYYNPGPLLQAEDRVLTPEGIEYNIISIANGIIGNGVVTHHEAVLQLP
jgi:hypothetical protein